MSWRLVFRGLRTSQPGTPTLPIPSPIPGLSFATMVQRRKTPKWHKKRKVKTSARVTPVQSDPDDIIPSFEAIVDRSKSLHFVVCSKQYLSSRPDHAMLLAHTSKRYKQLGIPRGRKVTRFLHKHSLLFNTFCHVDKQMWLGFTSLMDDLLCEETLIMDTMELDRVTRVRKLLMLTSQKRVHLSKLHRCRLVFGLPNDFRFRVLKYPEFFRVVTMEDGRYLELTNRDSSLAVSALEREFVVDEDKVEATFRFEVNKGKGSRKVCTLPLVSPYSDGSKLNHNTVEAEKYQLGVLHEFLSLTLEKRASIHHIVEFKDEFKLKKNTYQMLKRQRWAFYLAGTEMNWEIFLKDAYDKDGILIEKDPQVVFNEKLYKYATMQSFEEL